MSIWRRALQVAKSNINDITSRASSMGRGASLEEMSDEELEAELARRRSEHAAQAAADEVKEKMRHSKAQGTRESNKATADADSSVFADLSPAKRREIRQHYANLELPFGAGLDEVKQSYRRLMRKYHPDKHQDDPARRQLATQLSQKLTRAYNELSRLLRNAK